MFGSDQTQNVSHGATGVQAGRNVIINNGMPIAELHQTFNMWFEMSVPRMRELAEQASEERVHLLEQKVIKELAHTTTPIAAEKLADPDVQMAFKDAIGAASRYGDRANLDMLSKLLTQKMARSSTPFVEMVISEAIQAVPKLTKEQMSFLGFIFTLRSVSPVGASIAEMEKLAVAVWPIISQGFGLSKIQRSHLEYAGALSITTMLDGALILGVGRNDGIFAQLQKKYGQSWAVSDSHELKSKLSREAPTYFQIADKWERENGQQFELTSIGSAIGLALLMPVMPFPGMNYEQWLA